MHQAESQFGVEFRIRRPQAESTAWNLTHATPFAGGDLEYFTNDLLGGHVALAAHGAAVLVLHVGPTVLQLLEAHEDPLQDIDGLETGHHDRDAVLLRER